MPPRRGHVVGAALERRRPPASRRVTGDDAVVVSAKWRGDGEWCRAASRAHPCGATAARSTATGVAPCARLRADTHAAHVGPSSLQLQRHHGRPDEPACARPAERLAGRRSGREPPLAGTQPFGRGGGGAVAGCRGVYRARAGGAVWLPVPRVTIATDTTLHPYSQCWAGRLGLVR